MIRTLFGATALAMLPLAAVAEPSFSVNGAANFGFLTSGGLTQDSTTFDLGLDYENNGYRGHVSLSTLDDDPADDFEYEVGIGYGREIGQFSYDAGLTAYFLNNAGHQATALGLELGYALSDTTSAFYFTEVDIDTRDFLHEVGLSVALNDSFGVSAMLGTANSMGYGELGVEYAVNETVGMELLFADGADADPTLTFSLKFASPLSGR
jgi:hypothetical protein